MRERDLNDDKRDVCELCHWWTNIQDAKKAGGKRYMRMCAARARMVAPRDVCALFTRARALP